MSNELANQLCDALRRCGRSATFIAPYIKAGAFARLLAVTPDDVIITVVTRWRPIEIALGVSDLEVFDQCQSRPGSRLLLLDPLHAKYYRADDVVFVGSANLTFAGLGWSTSANVEILHQVDLDDHWRGFEERVFAASVLATAEVCEAVQAAVNRLPDVSRLSESASQPVGRVEVGLVSGVRWVPLSRTPESLFLCYAGRQDLITRAAMLAGQHDISRLNIPMGLGEVEFVHFVRAALLQQSVVGALREIARDGPRFGELKARVRKRFADELVDRDPIEATQTLMRWVTHFLPNQFRVRVYRFSEHLESVE